MIVQCLYCKVLNKEIEISGPIQASERKIKFKFDHSMQKVENYFNIYQEGILSCKNCDHCVGRFDFSTEDVILSKKAVSFLTFLKDLK